MARAKLGQQIDLREAIKTVALKQIAEKGAASLSLRAIARECNITAPAIYNHYPRRDDLVTALINEAFTSFGDALQAARDAHPADDHLARFRAITWAYHGWAIAHPQRYALIFGTPISGYKMGQGTSAVAMRSLLILASVLDAAYRAGKIHLSPEYASLTPGLQAQYQFVSQNEVPYPPIVMQLTLACWSAIHGLTSLELYGYLSEFLADRVQEFVRLEIDKSIRMLGLEQAG
jgi:AcrR family transcriptional regulator